MSREQVPERGGGEGVGGVVELPLLMLLLALIILLVLILLVLIILLALILLVLLMLLVLLLMLLVLLLMLLVRLSNSDARVVVMAMFSRLQVKSLSVKCKVVLKYTCWSALRIHNDLALASIVLTSFIWYV